jgi:Uma2 family endonuclease
LRSKVKSRLERCSRIDEASHETGAKRRRFTVEEYQCMGKAGILHEDDRVELIAGDIIEMPPIGPGHAGDVRFLSNWFGARVEGRAIVDVQNPIRLPGESEPEPDVVLLRPREDFYRRSHPTPEDILLVVEVADTSSRYDRGTKIPTYGRAGIPEAWLLTVSARRLEVFGEPSAAGYATRLMLGHTGVVSPLAVPDMILHCNEVL